MWSLGVVNENGFGKCLLYRFDTLEGRIEREFFFERIVDPLGKGIVRWLAALGHAGQKTVVVYQTNVVCATILDTSVRMMNA